MFGRLFFTGASVLLAAAAASAQNPQIANVATPIRNEFIGGGDFYASGFTVGGTSFAVTQVSAPFSLGSANNSVIAQIYEATGAGGRPSTVVGGLTVPANGQIAPSSSLANPTLLTFDFAGAIILNANTNYWIAFGTTRGSGSLSSSATPVQAGSNGVANDSGSFSANSGATWGTANTGDSGFPFAFAINGNPVSSVAPEPNVIGLFGIGAVLSMQCLCRTRPKTSRRDRNRRNSRPRHEP
jgi:hypothetical protein